MALSADILRGYTDTIILHQLSHGDSYGYQINKTISTLSGGEVELKEATLYTAFRRLEAAGFPTLVLDGDGCRADSVLLGQRNVRRAPPLLRHHGAGAGKAHQRFGGVGGHETPA